MGSTSFPPTLREGDFPDIGMSRGGYTLVCHGDDEPTAWADWLEPIACSFSNISSLADEHGVQVTDPKGGAAPSSILEFCHAVGIEMDSSPWEGYLISGTYWLGWIRKGTLRATKSRARALLASITTQIDSGVRRAVRQELDGIRDLDEFLERTADDRPQLRREIAELRREVHILQSEALRTAETAEDSLDQDTHLIDQSCVEIACAILRKSPARIVAGPLVLWDDGVVYAIVSRGGIVIPADSSPSKLIDALIDQRHPVVRVREQTVVSVWTSGPIFRKGAATINGWATVWMDQENVARKFEVDPPGNAESVYEVHRQLAASYPGQSTKKRFEGEGATEKETKLAIQFIDAAHAVIELVLEPMDQHDEDQEEDPLTNFSGGKQVALEQLTEAAREVASFEAQIDHSPGLSWEIDMTLFVAPIPTFDGGFALLNLDWDDNYGRWTWSCETALSGASSFEEARAFLLKKYKDSYIDEAQDKFREFLESLC